MDQIEYDSLTPTERKILRLVIPGKTTAMIANDLGMVAATVETHIKRARAKLGGVDRVRAGQAIRTFEGPTQSLATPSLGTGLGIAAGADATSSNVSDRSTGVGQAPRELNEDRVPFGAHPPTGFQPWEGRRYDRNAIVSVALIAFTILALVVTAILLVSLSESAQSLARTIFHQR